NDAIVVGTDVFPLHPGGRPISIDGVQVIYAGNTGDAASLISSDQAAGKIVAFSGVTSGISKRYPGAVAFIVIRPDASIGQIRRFVMTPQTLMKSDDDTASAPFTLFVPTSAVPKFLGVPVENARPGTLGRTLHGAIKFSDVDAPARNVVAILPGSDPKLK